MRELTARKNIRLQGYDYSRKGCYFITVCVKDKYEMFGVIAGGKMSLSEYGRIAERNLGDISAHIQGVYVNKFVVMPNHIHMILVVDAAARENTVVSTRAKSKQTVSKTIQQYKASVSRESGICGLWQPRFHDHIIHGEDEYKAIWRYIDENPANWAGDKYCTTL